MTLFPADPTESNDPEFVDVQQTSVGKGVFAVRPYPSKSVIGKITGQLILDDSYGSEYSFEYEDGVQLEPEAPFRFVNHSCEPNCEFDTLEGDPDEQGNLPLPHLYLIALEDIRPSEELTIDYNWPASSAIPCQCGTESCRGWVVAEQELEKIEPY